MYLACPQSLCLPKPNSGLEYVPTIEIAEPESLRESGNSGLVRREGPTRCLIYV
jgi:hypothetical protein